jgi:hypothetical protein
MALEAMTTPMMMSNMATLALAVEAGREPGAVTRPLRVQEQGPARRGVADAVRVVPPPCLPPPSCSTGPGASAGSWTLSMTWWRPLCRTLSAWRSPRLSSPI